MAPVKDFTPSLQAGLERKGGSYRKWRKTLPTRQEKLTGWEAGEGFL